MKIQIEKFTGNKINRKKLKEAIELSQRATKAFRTIARFTQRFTCNHGQRRDAC